MKFKAFKHWWSSLYTMYNINYMIISLSIIHLDIALRHLSSQVHLAIYIFTRINFPERPIPHRTKPIECISFKHTKSQDNVNRTFIFVSWTVPRRSSSRMMAIVWVGSSGCRWGRGCNTCRWCRGQREAGKARWASACPVASGAVGPARTRATVSTASASTSCSPGSDTQSPRTNTIHF